MAEKASFCGLDNNDSPLFAAEGNANHLQINLDIVCTDDPSGVTEQFSIQSI
jgi:hypothetical protein